MIAVNGSQISLNDIEVITATIDIARMCEPMQTESSCSM